MIDESIHLDHFELHRKHLLGAAYRFLGSYSDAEDVVQETWLRWAAVSLDEVLDPRAYLLRITTRLALNRLRTRRRQREDYVGEWLPEPVSDVRSIEPESVVETADSVSMAMMIVLETLSPLERTAFILRQIFAMPFSEIAATLDRSESAVRQLSHRARHRVSEGAPRHRVDPKVHRDLTKRFLEAVQTGDFNSLMTMIAPDATLVTDGGGKKLAAIRPIHTRDRVVQWLNAVGQKAAPSMSMSLRNVNGEPALIVTDGGAVDGVFFLHIGNNLIQHIYGIRNPDKLAAVNMSPEIDHASAENTR